MNKMIKKIKKEQVIYVVLLILIFTVICFTILKDKKNSLFYNKTYVQDTPIMIEKNNKIGYISTSNGRFIIKPIYDYGERFYGDYTIVKVNKNNTDYYRIIDKNNIKKLEFETYLDYNYIKEYNLWLIDGILYGKNFIPFYNEDYFVEYISNGLFIYKNKKSNESGIFNHLNKTLFEFKGTNIEIDKNNISENNIVVKSENNFYYCDVENKKIIYKISSNDYDMFLVDDNVIKLISKNNTIKHIVFKNNEIIYETTDNIENIKLVDNYIILDYGYNYIANAKKQRYYYYNIKTEKLTKTEPKLKSDNINDYGYELIYKNNKVGLKKEGNTILNTLYDEIVFIQLDLFNFIKHIYNQELVLLYSGSKVELYNLKNNKIIDTFNIKNKDYIQTIKNTPYIKIKTYSDNNENKLFLYNIITKKSMELIDYDSYYVDTNYVIVKKGNKSSYYNSDFIKIYEKK